MRTVIFTCVMLVLYWATDFAILMWGLDPPGYDGYSEMILILWFIFFIMDIANLLLERINYDLG